MTTKGSFTNGTWAFSEDGELTAPIDSTLPHRFVEGENGEVVDKYNGISDNAVRQQDHEEAQARVEAAQAEWDAAEEKVGDRPADLPELVLPEE